MAMQNSVAMQEVTDPVELATARVQDERFERNWAWFQTHASEIYAAHRGKSVYISGQELFVGDTSDEALDMSVLGRDVTILFAVIVDWPRQVVCMLGQRHESTIVVHSR